MSEQWEYTIFVPPRKRLGFFRKSEKHILAYHEEELNELGYMGWDCYHVNTNTVPATYYLKRKI